MRPVRRNSRQIKLNKTRAECRAKRKSANPPDLAAKLQTKSATSKRRASQQCPARKHWQPIPRNICSVPLPLILLHCYAHCCANYSVFSTAIDGLEVGDGLGHHVIEFEYLQCCQCCCQRSPSQCYLSLHVASRCCALPGCETAHTTFARFELTPHDDGGWSRNSACRFGCFKTKTAAARVSLVGTRRTRMLHHGVGGRA